MNKRTIAVDEKVPFGQLIPLSLQHTFAMFGASVLVPLVFNMDPSIVLLMNGIGTLLLILITRGKVPAYLGSSFAFLGPTQVILAKYPFAYALGGFFAVGVLGCFIAFIIRRYGIDWLDIVLPPAAMGAVVALIGLQLASATISGGAIGANIMGETATNANRIVFAVTLLTAVFGSVLFKKFWATIPILISIVVGYLTAIFFGLVDFSPLNDVQVFVMPHFQTPKFHIEPILTMLPVTLVIMSENISHQVVTSNIIGRDILNDPGLHSTILADNFSSALSALVGSVPTTTYGENIGVMAVTGVYSVQVIAGAAVFSIAMAFIGPLAALIQTIPGDVIGGVTFLLYGMIGASGLRLLVDEKVDFSKSSNLVLTSVILVAGLSGLSISFGNIELSGMVLASVVAVILSLIFHLCRKIGWLED
ncbi:uracil permease [Peptoniphilus sp. KCTC 25270]|uniref:uracil permease n=1 Tax=Peptoniphilus sp. KCTC 25270 TaxID=2897414 RepID=UPI001E564177|nr:uracil permease [Peptoniphilus sp. KCTC 25270]MCD1147254.1 uracil permease [Peptoniphilus sp. KCTC 25270]